MNEEIIYFPRCCGGGKNYGKIIELLTYLKTQGVEVNFRKASHKDKVDILKKTPHQAGQEYAYVNGNLILMSGLLEQKEQILKGFKDKIELQNKFEKKIEEK